MQLQVVFKGSVQGRRAVLGAGIATALVRVPDALATDPKALFTRQGEVRHTDEEWKSILSPSAYRVLRQEGTELPFSSPLNNEKREGVFKCAGCGSPVFVSTTKYNSGTGWPSFYQALPGTTDELPDLSIPFLPRTEVRCHVCQGHLGHVFDDGPRPTGLRYCMNGAALTFEPKAI
ncbi:methionine-R-sulfoxide reductase [Dunaliella salina]|uniref:Peptide-methionine (R)-S-oxide reductase n=1 Tax=Dunaliella salina TaxID=3046 RepID=A0ABQ7H0Q9_DUNSA|nr:methionine-R-sulfoxide reductase [Dunaliella salina]|eukprot:KAF5840421.1 methionine-R-sulfoxide reductase [Dunaliella salina]